MTFDERPVVHRVGGVTVHVNGDVVSCLVPDPSRVPPVDVVVCKQVQGGQHMSAEVSICQEKPARVSTCQQMSAHFRKCQQISVHVKTSLSSRTQAVCRQLMSFSANKAVSNCKAVTANVRNCQQMFAHVSKCQQISANARRCQHTSARACCPRPQPCAAS